MNYYDTNNDGQVNLGDNIESDHLNVLLEYCDYNGDQTLDACEVHDCIVMCENQWRLDNCPEGYEMLWCETPFECV
jgi:hypothetical protein